VITTRGGTETPRKNIRIPRCLGASVCRIPATAVEFISGMLTDELQYFCVEDLWPLPVR
jgi:hypothetical protein